MPIYPLVSIKRISRGTDPRGAKGATTTTIRTSLATKQVEATPLSCTLGFSIKRTFPEYRYRGPGTHRTLLQSPQGHVPELCLVLPLCTAAGDTRHRSPVPIYSLGLDKTNFPRIPSPSVAKEAQIPTTRTRSRNWSLTLRLATWRPHSSCTPGFSINRILFVLYPQDPSIMPELCLALLWSTASGRTRHRSSMPIYPLGFDRTNFPREPGQRGQQYQQFSLGPVPELRDRLRGVRTTFSHVTTPIDLYPGFSIKRIFPNTDPAGLVTTGPFYNPHTVPSLNFVWLFRSIPLLGTHGTGLICPFTPWDSIKRIFPGYRPLPPGQLGNNTHNLR